ncbi:MAG: 4-hydroxy-tetrahydrodipicolinate synthase [Ruminococcaceae bacterium]|nr:4-hydroxy-tetrahydrodipicolinate synthase [Oscillospiraceae bacterium]
MNMLTPLFSGICTALVTPFLNNEINWPILKILLQRQMDAGIETVILSGTTGESATLSDDEKLALFRQSKLFVGDKMKIIAGTGSNDTAHAVELSIAAQTCGVDGLLIVSPYYNKATPNGLIAHYASIADAVQLPVIAYNVPSRTGVDMPVSVYARLSDIPNVIGVKEASQDIGKFLRIRRECPDDFFLWCGNDHMTVPAISIGAIGVISVLSNLLPEKMNFMTYAALGGDFKAASELQTALLPWTDFLSCEVNPIPIKAAMAKCGIDCGIGRLPLTELSPEYENRLRELVN